MNKRYFSCSLELKEVNARTFEGYGSIFGNEDLGGDIVMPGAFTKSLSDHRRAGSMPQMFWMHQADRVPGKWLDMAEDEKGLAVQGMLAETPLGDEMRTLMKMDAVRGLSIGYMATEWDYEDGRRLIKAADLWEVSIVSLAMNPLAQIEAVKSRLSSRGEYISTRGDMEDLLRAGARAMGMSMSKSVAEYLAAKIFEGRRGKPGENRGEPGPLDDRGEPDPSELAALYERLFAAAKS